MRGEGLTRRYGDRDVGTRCWRACEMERSVMQLTDGRAKRNTSDGFVMRFAVSRSCAAPAWLDPAARQ